MVRKHPTHWVSIRIPRTQPDTLLSFVSASFTVDRQAGTHVASTRTGLSTNSDARSASSLQRRISDIHLFAWWVFEVCVF